MLPPKVKLEANEKKDLTTIVINQPDMLEDVTNIRDILEDLEPEPGKRFYYWEDGVDGYTLEPILSVVGGS